MAKQKINTDQLRIEVKKDVLMLSGSINASHVLEGDMRRFQMRLSDDTDLAFEFEIRHDGWYLSHNRHDQPKHYQVQSISEYGHSDIFIVGFSIANATLMIENEKDVYFGTPSMSKDQKQIHEQLVNYLKGKGFICVDEIKKDLLLLVAGEYGKDWR